MTQTTLEYGHAEEPAIFAFARRSWPFRVAFVCWIGPLAVGVSIFGLWVITNAGVLPILGLITLGVGTLMAAVGGVFLLLFAITGWPQSDRPTRQILLPAILLALLIASNFAAASAVMRAVDWVSIHWPGHHL